MYGTLGINYNGWAFLDLTGLSVMIGPLALSKETVHSSIRLFQCFMGNK
ncbi:hypothetical protein NXY07_00685 [Phocaeicola dorei]|nr:hypothetical protein [Phocaeicola dorei]